MSYSKNGGLRFVRIGRVQMSFCVCKSRAPAMAVSRIVTLALASAGFAAGIALVVSLPGLLGGF